MKALTNAMPLLANSSPYRTDDLDEARSHVSNMFSTHRLDIVGPNQALDVWMSRAQIEGISLVYHRHGARVRVRPDVIRDFYLLQLPIRGDTRITINQHDFYGHPKQAVLLSPDNAIDMTFSEGCEQLIVRVERSDLERHLEQQLGRRVSKPLQYAPAVPLTTPGAKEMIELLRFMSLALTDDQGICRSAIARRHMVSLFLSGFLTCLDHNYQDQLSEPSERAKPGHIEMAKDYIHAHLSEPITPQDIAIATDKSTRALFAGFQTYLGTTPMRYVKDLRLDRVREALIQADPAQVSITAVAMNYGFEHLGHFCADYKARFSERPRDTLRRSFS